MTDNNNRINKVLHHVTVKIQSSVIKLVSILYISLTVFLFFISILLAILGIISAIYLSHKNNKIHDNTQHAAVGITWIYLLRFCMAVRVLITSYSSIQAQRNRRICQCRQIIHRWNIIVQGRWAIKRINPATVCVFIRHIIFSIIYSSRQRIIVIAIRDVELYSTRYPYTMCI